ncbi:MAG: RNA methyltransferase [Actinomycetes bacterium]
MCRIDDPDDPRVNDYRSLTDVGLRRRREPQEGLFMAESHQVIARAITAGYPVRSVLTTPRWQPVLHQLADDPAVGPALQNASIFVASPDVVAQVTGYRVHRGALAAMSRLPLRPVSDVLRGASRVAVFENIVDHTNLGAGFRSAAALGVDAVLVTPECADPLYRRAVRVSMGAVFDVPWSRLTSWPQDINMLKAEGYTVVALTPAEDAVSLDDFAVVEHPKLALVLGTEGPGVTPEAQCGADFRLRIPMAGGADSLNVAAAAAVAFYATRR